MLCVMHKTYFVENDEKKLSYSNILDLSLKRLYHCFQVFYVEKAVYSNTLKSSDVS